MLPESACPDADRNVPVRVAGDWTVIDDVLSAQVREVPVAKAGSGMHKETNDRIHTSQLNLSLRRTIYGLRENATRVDATR